MAVITFPTRRAAEQAGYTSIQRPRRIESHGAVDILADEDGIYYTTGQKGYQTRHEIAKTVSVYLSEAPNKLKTPGFYAQMMSPGEYVRALTLGRQLMPSARAQHIKEFMNGHDIKQLLSIRAVEKQAQLPQNTLRNFLNGQRGLPIQHLAAIEQVLRKPSSF